MDLFDYDPLPEKQKLSCVESAPRAKSLLFGLSKNQRKGAMVYKPIISQQLIDRKNLLNTNKKILRWPENELLEVMLIINSIIPQIFTSYMSKPKRTEAELLFIIYYFLRIPNLVDSIKNLKDDFSKLYKVASHLQLHFHKKDTFLYRHGEQADQLFIIVKGSMSIFKLKERYRLCQVAVFSVN